MSTEYLKLDRQTAKKLFPSSPAFFQETLKATFGESTFSMKVTDRIKSFEDACEDQGLNPNDPIFTTGTPDVIAYNKLTKAIIPSLNEKWTPDWNNSNQRKWYCWFKYDGSGFRFYDSRYGLVFSSVGSRLCFKSEELAVYAAKQFQNEYNQLFN